MYRLNAKKSWVDFTKLSAILMSAVLIFQGLVLALPNLFGGRADAVVNYSQTAFDAAEVALWSVDRAVPSGGYSSTSFASRSDVLKMSIDNENASTQSSTFYNTEGLKRDIADSDAIKADLYVDSAWSSIDVRAGLWGVGYDAGANINFYPILEFTTAGEGDFTGWRSWDGYNGGWTNLSTPFVYDSWNTLELVLDTNSDLFKYYINDTLVKVYDAFGTQNISEIILNSYNYEAGASANYDVHWSGYSTGSSVPDAQSTIEMDVFGDTSAFEGDPGWMFNRDLSNATPIEFNSDEAVLGNGSLYVEPLSSTPAHKFIGELFSYTEIQDINSASYDFKIGAGGDASDENEFYLNIYANFGETTVGNYYDCKYDVVPTVGSTTDWTTVTFDPTMSYPVTTRGSSPYTCPNVPADMDVLSLNSRVRMFAINLGDTSANDVGLDGYFDNFVLDTNTQKTVYDFEPDVDRPVVGFVNPSVEDQAFSGDAMISFEASDNNLLNGMTVNIKDQNNSAHLGTCGTISGLNVSSHTLNCNIDTADFADGYYYLRAGATDVSGNNKTISRRVVFDNTKPSAQITYPSDDSALKGAFTVEGTASDATSGIDRVEYTVTQISGLGGSYVASVSSGTANYTGGNFNFDVAGLVDDFYRLKVQAFDNAGNWKYHYIDVQVDNTRPGLSFVSPDDGEFVSGDMEAEVLADSLDGSGIKTVAINLYNAANENPLIKSCGSNSSVGGLATYEFSCVLDTTEQVDGTYTLRSGTTDMAGNNKTITRQFVIDNTKPDAQITSPGDDSLLASSDVTVEGTVSDATSGVDRIEYRVNQITALGGVYVANIASGLAVYNSADGTFSYDISGLVDGFYRLRVQAFDNAGNWKHHYVDVEIDTTAPAVFTLNSIQTNTDTFRTISGTTDPGATVEVTVESTPQTKSVVADAFGVWSIYFDNLEEGNHTVTAISTDAAGNSTAPLVETFTVSAALGDNTGTGGGPTQPNYGSGSGSENTNNEQSVGGDTNDGNDVVVAQNTTSGSQNNSQNSNSSSTEQTEEESEPQVQQATDENTDESSSNEEEDASDSSSNWWWILIVIIIAIIGYVWYRNRQNQDS